MKLHRAAAAWFENALLAHARVLYAEKRGVGLLCLAATLLYPRVPLGGAGGTSAGANLDRFA